MKSYRIVYIISLLLTILVMPSILSAGQKKYKTAATCVEPDTTNCHLFNSIALSEYQSEILTKHRLLFKALTTRVLSEREMNKVLDLGVDILDFDRGGCGGDCTAYYLADDERIHKKFLWGLKVQAQIRTLKARKQ